jgi:beta-lactamase regulating signal transducer with metallopeptidase domain
MTTWLIVNVLISLFVCILLVVGGDCPHRFRFKVCFLAMLLWLVPWQYFAGFLNSFLPTDSLPIFTGIAPVEGSAGDIATVMPWQWLLDYQMVLLSGAFIVGAGLFTVSLIIHCRFMHTLKKCSVDGSHLWSQASPWSNGPEAVAIRIQDRVQGAWNSGIFKPVIWINRDLENNPDLPAVLLHESVHIRNRDNVYLAVITLLENLFWWNPLVVFLGKTAREAQELACDEQCAGHIPDYRTMLNNLILLLSPGNERSRMAALNSNMFQGKNFNVRRIQTLQRRYTMKARHYLTTLFLAIFSVLTVGLISAQEGSDQPAQIVTDVEEKRNVDPDYVPTTREILAGLELYATNLEKAYVELKTENETLRNQVVELQNEVNRLQ